jgi:hypothetical protein
MFFTKDILESVILIAIISAAIVWYGIVLARKEEQSRADSKKAA